MIAEPGVLSTSPWNSDFLLKDFTSDFIKSYLNTNDGSDFGFSLLDVETDRLRNGCIDAKANASSSSSPSSASSECSEELSFDFITSSSCGDILPVPDHDYLNTSLNLLDDSSLAVCSDDFDWVVGADFTVSGTLLSDDSCCDRPSTLSTFSLPKPKRNHPPDPVNDTKLWSKMTLEDQLEAVEGLTRIISYEMGLREQLDIIRIIQPTAVISPSDKEFVIDLTLLNDQKLCQVREYIRKVQNTSISRQENKSSSRKSDIISTALCSNPAFKNGTTPSPGKSKNLKREAKERRAPQKVFRQRQKKEYRQLMKERRSGLFVHEQVMSLTIDPVVEEDTDIDILG